MKQAMKLLWSCKMAFKSVEKPNIPAVTPPTGAVEQNRLKNGRSKRKSEEIN